MPSDFELQASLWTLAEGTARQEGFGIADNCEVHLRAFVNQGAARVIADQRADDPTALAEAGNNVVSFVQAMVMEARTLGFSELHEPTFFNTLARLCPIWPFC